MTASRALSYLTRVDILWLQLRRSAVLAIAPKMSLVRATEREIHALLSHTPPPLKVDFWEHSCSSAFPVQLTGPVCMGVASACHLPLLAQQSCRCRVHCFRESKAQPPVTPQSYLRAAWNPSQPPCLLGRFQLLSEDWRVPAGPPWPGCGSSQGSVHWHRRTDQAAETLACAGLQAHVDGSGVRQHSCQMALWEISTGPPPTAAVSPWYGL